MNPTPVAFHRPRFRSAEDFIEAARQARAAGREPWPPETRDEIIAAVEHFPDWGRTFIPTGPWRSMMRIPETLGVDIQPWTETQKESFLLTLRDDPEFRAAVKFFLLGAAR
jgi:hypothetical protein